MLVDVEIAVEDGLYQEFSQLCAELGVTPEHYLERMFAWIAENPAAAMAYIREAAAEQSKLLEN